MPANYDEVEVIEGAGGIFARITRRRAPTGFYQYSFQILRRFRKGDEQRETGWMNRAHAPAIRELAERAEQRIAMMPPA